MEQQKTNSPGAPQLDASIEQLNNIIEETNSFAHKARTASLLLYLAMLVVVLIFGWRFYSTISKNITKEKFLASAEIRVKELQPAVVKSFRTVYDKVLPVYTAQAKKALAETVPQLKELSEKELNAMLDKVNGEIDVLTKEIMSTKDSLLKSLYVNLTLPEFDAAKVINEQEWANEFNEVTKAVIEPFTADWNALRATIKKFDNPSLPNEEGELYRQMASCLLLLLNEEIMTEGK